MNAETYLTPKSAIRKIENFYICYRNKQLFKLLKITICASELSITNDLLKKVAPLEYGFFKNEQFIKWKIKFRFGGTVFPPKVYYKIFRESRSHFTNNFSTYKSLNMVFDDRTLPSRAETSNPQVYKKYFNFTDDVPSEYGGKNNQWKKLDQSVLSRNCLIFDVVEYVNLHNMSKSIKNLIYRGFQNEKLENQFMKLAVQENSVIKKYQIRNFKSRKQILKPKKMVNLYGEKGESTEDNTSHNKINNHENTHSLNSVTFNWEDDAQYLCNWTKQLSINYI